MNCEDLVSKNTFLHGTSCLLLNWKVALLVAFVWPLVLEHWHTFGLVDFASNILRCGMKMYSVNNSHFVNIVWIEQVLDLVVIHPVFLRLNL